MQYVASALFTWRHLVLATTATTPQNSINRRKKLSSHVVVALAVYDRLYARSCSSHHQLYPHGTAQPPTLAAATGSDRLGAERARWTRSQAGVRARVIPGGDANDGRIGVAWVCSRSPTATAARDRSARRERNKKYRRRGRGCPVVPRHRGNTKGARARLT
jgi:hypothetical protein